MWWIHNDAIPACFNLFNIDGEISHAKALSLRVMKFIGFETKRERNAGHTFGIMMEVPTFFRTSAGIAFASVSVLGRASTTKSAIGKRDVNEEDNGEEGTSAK